MRIYVLLAIAAMLLLSATGAMAAAFTNGSFEDPVRMVSGVPTNGRSDYTVATGWSTYASAGGNPQLLRYFNDPLVIVPDGAQYGQFQTTTTGTYGGYRQTFDVVAGTQYTISGWFKTLSGNAGAKAGVDLTGTATRPVGAWGAQIAFPLPAVTPFTQFTFNVTATGPSMTLFLEAEQTATTTNKGAAFDGITVTAIPEPGSIVALLTGLVGLVGIRRRK